MCSGEAKEFLPGIFSSLWEEKYSKCQQIEKLDNQKLILDTFVTLDQKLHEHLYEGSTATIAIVWSVGESRLIYF